MFDKTQLIQCFSIADFYSHACLLWCYCWLTVEEVFYLIRPKRACSTVSGILWEINPLLSTINSHLPSSLYPQIACVNANVVIFVFNFDSWTSAWGCNVKAGRGVYSLGRLLAQKLLSFGQPRIIYLSKHEWVLNWARKISNVIDECYCLA